MAAALAALAEIVKSPCGQDLVSEIFENRIQEEYANQGSFDRLFDAVVFLLPVVKEVSTGSDSDRISRLQTIRTRETKPGNYRSRY